MEAGGQQAAAPITPATQPAKSNKKTIIIILAVFGALVLIGIICVIIFVMNIFGFVGEVIDDVSSNVAQYPSLHCEYSGGAVTIYHSDYELKGYSAVGKVNFDYDDAKLRVKRIGVDAFLEEYEDEFEGKYSGGFCRLDSSTKPSSNDDDDDDWPLPSSSSKPSDDDKNSSTSSDVKVVGDDTYGYLEVPNNWYDFVDVDGASAKQWSYASVYIVSLDTVDNPTGATAKELAQGYMAAKMADSEVTGVTGATVTIGSDKKYTAYQVYMYYPSDSTYLVTYWFEDENGKDRYIALEGPEDIVNYTSIPESFRLKK